MRLSRLFAATSLLAACSASPAVSNEQQRVVPSQPTAGAKVEPSGFWTVLEAPRTPPEPRAAQRDGTLSIYAQIAGVSNEEAERRRKAQEALRPEFERLMRTLRAKERGNYTDAELIHRPDWAYVIYFKRSPQATLAKYSKNPRFKARWARYTEQELQRLTKNWIERLNGERLTTGYSMNARHGSADIDMLVSKEEFEAIAKRNGWDAPPEYLNLKFGDAPVAPAVAANVAAGIRIYPRSDRNLGATNQAAYSGRIILRDGCFYVAGLDGSMKLAYFAREVGVGRDNQGYLALRTRSREPRHLGRIGEQFTWAGPIPISETAPMVKELRTRCGTASLMHVGIPNSTAMFNARWGIARDPVAPPHRRGADKPEPVIQPGLPEAPPVPRIASTPPPMPTPLKRR